MMHKTLQQEILDRWLADYSGIFYKLVRVYALNHHDQEDLFQEIVFQLWRSVPGFRGTAKESTYVYQVALFAAMAWSRKEIRRTDHLEASTELMECHLFMPIPVKDSRLEWLYEQISKMKVVDRSLILLLLEGYNYREIASLIGLSESNVGSRLTRLKQKLATLNIEVNSHEL
jgi:RNA polymerase sigma-70 factor (ECF subfamily)